MIGATKGRLARSLLALPDWLVTYMPGPVGRQARYLFWKSRLRHLGRGVTFGVGVQITNPGYVSIGDNSWVDDYVVLLAGPPAADRELTRRSNSEFVYEEGELVVGKNCHIAQQVTLQGHGGLVIGDDSGVASGARIYSLSHHYRVSGASPKTVFKFTPRAPREEQALIAGPVVLSRWTAVGLNAVVLPGVTVGEGTWVATLSLVAADLPPNVVASGSPAKIVKEIRQRGTQG